MITIVRNKYEVFGLRQIAKSVKSSCLHCQRVDAKTCNEDTTGAEIV